nr:hypothetical protein [Bacilli bacterium]
VKGNLVASMPELNKGFDFGQWRKNFFSRYGRFRDDDISIALSCFGYKGDPNYFKLFHLDDRKIVNDFEKVWERRKDIQIAVAQKEGALSSHLDYFRSRSATIVKYKLPGFVERLTSLYLEARNGGEKDIAISEEVAAFIKNSLDRFYCDHFLSNLSEYEKDPELGKRLLNQGELKDALMVYLNSLKWLNGKTYTLEVTNINDPLTGEELAKALEKDISRAREESRVAKEEFDAEIKAIMEKGDIRSCFNEDFYKEFDSETEKEIIAKELLDHGEEVVGMVVKALEDNYDSCSKIEEGYFSKDRADKCRAAIRAERTVDDALMALMEENERMNRDSFARRTLVLGK